MRPARSPRPLHWKFAEGTTHIDYALFLLVRHREYLARGMTVAESTGRAVSTAGRAVVIAGGTVVIAILGLAVAGIPFMTAGGIAVSVIVLIMIITSVTLLPAFLGIAGHRMILVPAAMTLMGDAN